MNLQLRQVNIKELKHGDIYTYAKPIYGNRVFMCARFDEKQYEIHYCGQVDATSFNHEVTLLFNVYETGAKLMDFINKAL